MKRIADWLNTFGIASAAEQALAALGLLALVFGLGFVAGQRTERASAAAQALKVEQANAKHLDRARKEGDWQVTQLQQQLATARDYRDTTTERLRHAPLIIASCAPKRPAAALPPGRAAQWPAVAAVAAAPSTGATPGTGPGETASAAPGVDDSGDMRLTVAAVSLWNSALAGHDVPEGACSPDDAASAACAAAAGLTVRDAWRNQATNAASCAADRARYQRLIDYVQRVQGTPLSFNPTALSH